MIDVPFGLFLLSFAGFGVLMHTCYAEYRGRLTEHTYWFRAVPCVVASTVPVGYLLAMDPVHSHPVLYATAALCICFTVHAARKAYRTRPLPLWYGGAHERIDNP